MPKDHISPGYRYKSGSLDPRPLFGYNERDLHQIVPHEIINWFGDKEREVFKKFTEIEFHRIRGSDPRQFAILTAAVHGEEDRGNILREFETHIRRNQITNSGDILLMRINSKKERHLFPDESPYAHPPHPDIWNLNDAFLEKDQPIYTSGDWSEFFALPYKTQQFGWLLLRFFEQEKQRHPNRSSLHVDIHQMDGHTIPHVLVDNYGPKVLNGSLTDAFDLGYPVVTDEEPENIGTFTGATSNHGYHSMVIEWANSMRTHSGNKEFLFNALCHLLWKQGVIDNLAHSFRTRDIFKHNRTLQLAQELYEQQLQEGSLPFASGDGNVEFRRGNNPTPVEPLNLFVDFIHDYQGVWNGGLSFLHKKTSNQLGYVHQAGQHTVGDLYPGYQTYDSILSGSIPPIATVLTSNRTAQQITASIHPTLSHYDIYQAWQPDTGIIRSIKDATSKGRQPMSPDQIAKRYYDGTLTKIDPDILEVSLFEK